MGMQKRERGKWAGNQKQKRLFEWRVFPIIIPGIGSVKRYCMSIKDFMHGRFRKDPGFHLTYRASRWGRWSFIARSKTRCAQEATSRCSSAVGRLKGITEVSRISESEQAIRSCSAKSRMKGTSLRSPGTGQIANGGRCGPHSGCASNVSRKPGHRPTSQSWPSAQRHSNLPNSINVRAKNVCKAPSHRSMPTRCSTSAIVTDPIRFASCSPFFPIE